MGYLLIIMLFCVLLLSYFISRGDLISPWFLSVVFYLISSLVAVINIDKWGEQIHAKTVLIIILGLIAFGIGQMLSGVVKLNINGTGNNGIKKINIPQYKIFWTFTIGMLIVFLTFKRLIEIAYIGGYSGNGYFLNYARIALINYDVSWGNVIGILQFFAKGIGYIFIYVFVNNIFYERKLTLGVKKNYRYILPIIPSILLEIMGTGRSGFIRLTAMIFFLGIIRWKIKNGWKNTSKKNLKIILIAFIALICFYIIFINLGDLTGRNLVYKINDTISIYTGGSIVALDNFLDSFQCDHFDFGEETLYGVKYILSLLGFDVLVENRHLEFTYFNNGFSTNVYTALGRYIHDYGYLGMILIQFFIGGFFGSYYKLIKSRNKNDVWVIIYAYIANALVMQSIDDSFLTVFLSVSQIFSILFILVCYKIFVKNKHIHD